MIECTSEESDSPVFDETHVKLDLQLTALLHYLDGAAVRHQRLHRTQDIAAAPAAVLHKHWSKNAGRRGNVDSTH